MAGVDHCIELGIADPERLGVMGGSYGGFMTNWAIGHTNRFRAAISMFGIFNLQTDYANSDFPRWDYEYLGGWYWEVPELYRRLSPGTYVQNIQTPTLILHGDADNNTFISNSKEMYQALRHRGVTVQFVHYPREGHGVREPNHKLDEVRRSLAWMDHHLRHKGEEAKRYRLRDLIPSPSGTLELSVLSCEQGHYLGTPAENKETPTTLWEIEFTLHKKENDKTTPPLRFSLSDVRLFSQDDTESAITPIGVPVKASGGKVLIEGENLHLDMNPNPKTGEWAFGCMVVLRLPKQGGEYLLYIADFPPVTLLLGGKEEEKESEER